MGIAGQTKWLVLQGVWQPLAGWDRECLLATVKQSETLEAGRRAYEKQRLHKGGTGIADSGGERSRRTAKYS